MSEAIIAKLIENRVLAWADEQDIKVAIEGVAFEPEPDKIYARLTMLPLPTTSEFLEGEHEALTGIYQVDIVGPKGKGLGAMRVIALSLKDKFPVNGVLTDGTFRMQITSPVSLGPIIDDRTERDGAKPARISLPCSFNYRADVT